MNKRAQAQIITTVLIILLVLAAIVIVWQVVSGTIEEGGEEISAQSGCMGVSMEISGYDSGVAGTDGNITVRRGQGSTETKVTGYKLFVKGTVVADTTYNLDPLDTHENTTAIYTVEAGDTMAVAAVVDQNTVCSASAEVVAE